jgi:hypothetical protein
VYLDDTYILKREFMDFVKEIIKSKGISTCKNSPETK